MKSFFSRNIDNRGRLVRAFMAAGLFIAAGFGFYVSVWIGLGLAALGFFGVFEALRGWCALRACGVKTKF